jgi:hypothetical protein
MDRNLAKAVIHSFRGERAEVCDRLACFEYRHWVENYRWLDASGLALYFLDRVRSLELDDVVPDRVLARLTENATDNRKKTEGMYEEFVRLNRKLQAAGVEFANLKGFSLVPDASPDAALRCQFDLDFLVASRDVALCEEVLKQEGYVLDGIGRNVREYKAGSGQVPSIRELYKAKPQRSVEIHIASSQVRDKSYPDDRLSRIQWKLRDGFKFPVLSDCDQVLSLAHHLFKHLKSEWTRASWILEYARYIHFHRFDDSLWLEVEGYLSADSRAKVAVGAATLLAYQSFGIPCIPPILTVAITELPVSVRLWIERYGNNVLFTPFPGTKLYLLLERALWGDEGAHSVERSRKLFPLHRPPKITVGSERAGLLRRMKAFQAEGSYLMFRLRFHVTQGIAYMIEESRWKRDMASMQG